MPTTYPSNWRVPTGTKLLGANLLPTIWLGAYDTMAQTGGIDEKAFAECFKPANFPAALDIWEQEVRRMANHGVNCIRLWTCAPEGATLYSFYTHAQHAAQIAQMAAVCQKYGIYLYVTAHLGFVETSPPLITAAQLATWLGVLAPVLDPLPNVIALDLSNEAMTLWSLSEGTTIVAAARAGTTLPITISTSDTANNIAGWSSAHTTRFNALGLDFAALSIYFDIIPTDVGTISALISAPILLNEVGAFDLGATDVRPRWQAIPDASLRDDCAGGLMWSGNWGLLQGIYDSWGTSATNPVLGGHVPHAPLDVPAYDVFTRKFNIDQGTLAAIRMDMTTRTFHRKGAISGWQGKPGWSNKLTIRNTGNYSGATCADVVSTNIPAYINEIPRYPDYVITSNWNLANVESATNQHDTWIWVQTDIFSARGSQQLSGTGIMVGYSHYNMVGQTGPGWYAIKTVGGTQSLIAFSAAGLTAGVHAVSVTVASLGTTITLAVDGSTIFGPSAIGTYSGPKLGRVGLGVYGFASGTSNNAVAAQAVPLDFQFTPTLPFTPDTVAVSLVGSTTASLTTSGSSGVASRQWHRYTLTGSPLTTKTAVSGATGSTLGDTGLTTGAVYFYCVLDTDSNGYTIRSNEVQVVTSSAGGSVPMVGSSLIRGSIQ